MDEILLHRLVGMPIVGTNGTTLGTLENITIDLETGGLRTLVVEPHDRSTSSITNESDDDTRVEIPFERIEAVRDRIVVQYGQS